MEADPTAISYRVALRNDDIPIGEQTVAQVCNSHPLFCLAALCRNSLIFAGSLIFKVDTLFLFINLFFFVALHLIV